MGEVFSNKKLLIQLAGDVSSSISVPSGQSRNTQHGFGEPTLSNRASFAQPPTLSSLPEGKNDTKVEEVLGDRDGRRKGSRRAMQARIGHTACSGHIHFNTARVGEGDRVGVGKESGSLKRSVSGVA